MVSRAANPRPLEAGLASGAFCGVGRGDAMRADRAEGVLCLPLTEGGPGDAVLRHLKLAPLGQAAWRAAVVLALVAWVPLLLLSVVEGLAVGGAQIPFVYDLAAHVRFLVALPVLLLAEIPIGLRLREVTANFVTAGLVRVDQRARFADMIADAVRFRDSRVAELVVLGAAYVTTYTALSRGPLQSGSTWHAPGAHDLTPVGCWYAFVSLPLFQFLLYRWLWRMVVWTRFLRWVSTLDLQLTPTHPDRAGGLGFLGKACVPFGALLFAASTVVSSAIGTRVLFGGARLESFQMSYAALFVVALAVFAGPLLLFAPTLMALKHRGLVEYGTLASRYTQLFHRKWVEVAEATEESVLGTADIQSLADLGNSFELIRKMRVLPIQLVDFAAMALPGVLPAIPLAATVMPVREIVKGLLHLLA